MWKDKIKPDLELDSAGSEQVPVAGFCGHGYEPSGSIKKEGYF
jgi:hypothetical protein